jgi:hypothetical protein
MAKYGHMEGLSNQEAPFSMDLAMALQNDAFKKAMELLPPKDEAAREEVYRLILEAAGGIAAGSIIEKR